MLGPCITGLRFSWKGLQIVVALPALQLSTQLRRTYTIRKMKLHMKENTRCWNALSSNLPAITYLIAPRKLKLRLSERIRYVSATGVAGSTGPRLRQSFMWRPYFVLLCIYMTGSGDIEGGDGDQVLKQGCSGHERTALLAEALEYIRNAVTKGLWC